MKIVNLSASCWFFFFPAWILTNIILQKKWYPLWKLIKQSVMLREFYCQYYVFMIRARGSNIKHMSIYYISSLRDPNTIRSIKYNLYEFKKTKQTWNNICRDICAGIMGICQLRSHHGHEPHGRWHVDIWHEWHLVSMLTNIITSVIFPALWLKNWSFEAEFFTWEVQCMYTFIM